MLRTLLIAWLLAITLPVVGLADSTTRSVEKEARRLRLDQVLELALRHSPEIKKLDAALADKLATASEVQTLENPELEAEALVPTEKLGDLRITPSYQFKLTQTFRLSHLGMRQTYAAALKQTARLEQQADLLRVLNETTLLYYRLWMLQKREQILADSEQQARDVTVRIAEAVEKNETPSTEGNLFKAEAIRFGVELKATQAERDQAQMDLLSAIGSTWQEVRLEAPSLLPIPQDRFKLTSFAQNRANLQRLVMERQRASSRRHDVAKMDIFPELSFRGIYERSDNGDEQEAGAGVLVRVPIWDFNQAELTRSRAGKAVADAEAQALDRMTFDRIVETRMKRAVALQTRAEAYWNDVLPAYQKSYELSRRQFEEGQASMLQLWQVQQKVAEASEKALEDTVDALAARTLLEQAIGGRIEELP